MLNIKDYYNPPAFNGETEMLLPTNNATKKRQSVYDKYKTKVILLLLFYIAFFRVSINYTSCDNEGNCSTNSLNAFKFINETILHKRTPISHTPFSKVSKSFDILKPETQSNKYDKHVFTHELLIDEEFGHTWGKVATKTFSPSDIPDEFDFIEMTLDVSINGTQYDRLINMYLNDVMIWRSSTIEPLNRQQTKSRVRKDITRYIALFKNEKEIELKFQLENIIAGDLDGIFTINLKIDYYLKNKDKFKDKIPKLDNLERALLNSLNPYDPPDRVKPLFLSKQSDKAPLLRFPATSNKNKPYRLESLDIHEGSQKYAMELFISGNAAEEFWYSNILDAYKGKFDDYGYSTLGHGPVRYLNVYLCNSLDAVKIFNSIPIPVVFTGGFSPSLWKPMVSLGCFDLKGIYIDLTPYLQFLVLDDHYLEFEVVSSNTEEFDSSIGDNWLISGNLMEWDQHDLTFQNIIKEMPLVEEYQANAEDTDSLLKQNVTSASVLSKEFGFQFDEKEYVLQVTYNNSLSSHINLKEYGSDETSVLSIQQIKSYVVLDEITKEIVLTGVDNTIYAFFETLKISDEIKTQDSRFDTNAVTTFDRYVKMYNAQKDKSVDILQVAASQSGDAVYHISSKKGNSGSGSSVHAVKIDRIWPFSHSYSRDVVVTKNKVIIDVHDEK